MAESHQSNGKQALIFIVLVCANSWVLWIPLVLEYRSGTTEVGDFSKFTLALWFLGSWVPSLLAIGLTLRAKGRAGVVDLWRKIWVRKGSGIGYLVAIGFPLLIWWIMALWATSSTEAMPAIDPARWVWIPIALIMAIPFGPIGEEFGWRGYLQPRLLDQRGALMTGVIIGLVWSVWHLPLFWAPAGTSLSGSEVTLIGLAGYTLSLIVFSVVMSLLAGPTKGSLLFPILMHATWNGEPMRFLFAPMSDELAERMGLETLAVIIAGLVAIAILIFKTRKGNAQSHQ